MGIRALFGDIGGVLLTNGWDRTGREQAAAHFGIDLVELNNRHQEVFGTYELGKISLEEYIHHAVFNKKRDFTPEQFAEFMRSGSAPFSDMLTWVKKIKEKYHLKVTAVSNEGRELTDYRIKQFQLDSFIDTFVISAFVAFRKPDPSIYRLALDLTQVPASETFYLEDRDLFVQM